MDRFLSDRVPPNLATVEPIEQLYPAATLDRLREIKRRVDEDDVIRGNHPLLSTRRHLPSTGHRSGVGTW